MAETSTPESRRSRARRQEEPETVEQPAIETPAASVDAQNGEPEESSPAGEDGAEKPGEKKKRERKAYTVETGREPTWRVKVSVFLTAPTAWMLKHMIADSPGKSEADIVEDALTPVLKGHEYPKQPDWLRELIRKEAQRREEEARQKGVSAK